MAESEIDAIRKLLTSKPRPVGWLERRERLDEVGSAWPVAADIACEAVDCDGVRGEWSLAPGSDPSKVLLFFHGGGYCSGSIVSHRRMVTEAGRAMGVRTLAIDYRRAPEHAFPAQHEDALTAWRFLRRQGIAAGRIVVGGDSAGGNLSLSLINRLRAAKEPLPGCAWLVSPWTDLTMSGATLVTKDAVDPLIHKAYLEELADAYAPPPIDRRDPLISPLFCRSARLSAHADPGRLGRDPDRGRDAARGSRRHCRCRCAPGNLAAHDPRLAGVERRARRWPACACRGERIRPRMAELDRRAILPSTNGRYAAAR